jgi:hypothetical protein
MYYLTSGRQARALTWQGYIITSALKGNIMDLGFVVHYVSIGSFFFASPESEVVGHKEPCLDTLASCFD